MTQRTPRRANHQKQSGLVAMLAGIVVVGLIGAAVVFARTSASSPTTTTSAATEAAVARPPAAASANSNPVPTTGAAPSQKAGDAPTAVTAQDGVVRLAVADFSDAKARFYTFKSAGKTIPFFVLKSSDGVIRSAFDACDVCYPAKKGYRQEGDDMVCNNCGVHFPSAKIGMEAGGCNPSPLAHEVQGGTILIKAADLEAGAKFF